MRYLGGGTFGSILLFLLVGAAAAGLMTVVAAAGNASYLYNDAEDAFPVIEYKASNSIVQIDPKHPDFVLIEYTGPHVIEFYSPMYVLPYHGLVS